MQLCAVIQLSAPTADERRGDGEDKASVSISGSIDNGEFEWMAAKAIAEVCGGEARSGTYQEYLDWNPSRAAPKPIHIPIES